MRLDLNALPTDANGLHTLVRELVEALDAERGKNAKLQRQVAWLSRQHFGRKSEQIPEEQLRLWLDAMDEDAGAAEAPEPDRDEPVQPRRHARRAPLPEHLARTEVTLRPDSTSCAACGGELHEFGEEVTEQLDYRPASFFVRRFVRPKYACRGCETVTTAELPAQPIDKGRPGPGLLAHVLVSKYADHQPLYRLSQMFARERVELPRATLCGWVGKCAPWLAPLVERMTADVLSAPVIHTDDTPVPVLDPGRGQTKQGRLWVYLRAAGADPPAVLYDYTPSRAQAGPQAFLEHFRGYLQADAFPGYDALYASGAVYEVACWMHGRRKFYDIARAGNAPLAAQALAFIKTLYEVERAVRDAEPEARRQYREQHARPVLEAFKAWLDTALQRLPPRGELAKAMRYLTRRWTAFTRYLDDGRLAIDNGAAERAFKGPILGRKNWMFAGSDAGGQRAAIVYSLIETCKLNAIEPFAYLSGVLARLPTHPANRIEELLPYHWKDARDKASAADAA
jgi:transposase